MSSAQRQTATPFAAVTGLQLAVPPAQRVALRGMAQPDMPHADYVALNLPVVVGALSDKQRQDFAPQLGVGDFNYSNKMDVADFARLRRRGLQTLARELLGRPNQIEPGMAGKNSGLRFQRGEEALAWQKILQQAQLVADILCFDQKAFGTRHAHIAVDFHQDRPSPHQTLAPMLHTDEPYRPPVDGVVGRMFRSYSLRSSLGTEFLRDSIYASPLADSVPFQALLKGQITAVAPQALAGWIDQVKSAGHWLDSTPNEVVLRSRERTWHQSKRPAQMQASTLLRLNIGAIQS